MREAFSCEGEPWYVQVLNAVDSSTDPSASGSEDELMKLVREEMAQFFDVVKDKEFRKLEEKYSNSR